jgi:hypothetical protein
MSIKSGKDAKERQAKAAGKSTPKQSSTDPYSRNFTKEQMIQRIHDNRLLVELSKTPHNMDGMSVQDRLDYIEQHRTTPYEFGLKEYGFRIEQHIPEGASAEEIRSILKEKDLVDYSEKPPGGFPNKDKVLHTHQVTEGLSAGEIDAFFEKYPSVLKQLSDKGQYLPDLDPTEGGYTTAQLEKLADGFQKIREPGPFSWNNKFDVANKDVALFSQDKDIALSSLVGTWAVSGGTTAQKVLHDVAKSEFSVNKDKNFYDPWGTDSYPYSHERMAKHTQALYNETQSYYQEKLKKKYDSKTIDIYRGVNISTDSYTPAAVESWTTQKSTVGNFKFAETEGRKPYTLQSQVSIKDVLWSYESVAGKYDWPPEKDLTGKKEYVVFGGAHTSIQMLDN